MIDTTRKIIKNRRTERDPNPIPETGEGEEEVILPHLLTGYRIANREDLTTRTTQSRHSREALLFPRIKDSKIIISLSKKKKIRLDYILFQKKKNVKSPRPNRLKNYETN